MPGGNDLNLFSERSSVRKQEPRRNNWGGTCQIKNNHKTKAYGKRRTKHELNSVEPINFEIGSSQYSFLQFPAPSWKAAVPFHWSETNGDLAMIETFFNTLDNYSHVSIIARSPLVSLRCKGMAIPLKMAPGTVERRILKMKLQLWSDFATTHKRLFKHKTTF